MRLIYSIFAYAAVATASASFTPAEEITPIPDEEWDHVIRGASIGGAAFANETHPIYISDYQLRAKELDPATLGVDTVKQYSGYLDDVKDDKHFFFWFFESRNDPKNDPIVIWLNGGPGCSSLIGLFDSLGPSRIPDKSYKPERNAHSWNNNASVIFIDQPVNTGFSYSKNPIKSSVAAAKDMAAFLDLFFTKFKQYSTQPFHIAGQSYAGHWIPALGHEIVTNKYTNINLKSLLIGNGLTDCLTQYRHFAPMACGKGGHPAVLGASDCKSMEDGVAKCEPYIQKCYDSLSESACGEAVRVCNNAVFPIYNRSGRSHYDVRVKSGQEYKGYAPEWLNKAEVKKALGVEANRRYDRCSSSVYRDVVGSGDCMLPRHRVIPDILARIPILAYSGDADFICAWLGNQAWTAALEWPGKQAFNDAKMTPISVNGKEYGKVKHADKFAFMQIYNAGHSVAQSQPEAGLDFLNRWMSGEWQK